MILRCWYIDEWMQLVDKLGQQEAVMVVIINKVATRQGLWQASIGRHLNLLRDPHCPTVQFGQSEKSPTSLPTPYERKVKCQTIRNTAYVTRPDKWTRANVGVVAPIAAGNRPFHF